MLNEAVLTVFMEKIAEKDIPHSAVQYFMRTPAEQKSARDALYHKMSARFQSVGADTSGMGNIIDKRIGSMRKNIQARLKQQKPATKAGF